MLKLVLFLQVLILILFVLFGFIVYQEGKAVSENLTDALVVIDEVKAILPKLDLALDSINQLQTVFDSLESLSEILSILTNPFSSGD